MRKIILASRSRARQKLLKQIGLKFTVLESKVREAKTPKGPIEKFVVANAVKKAKAAASRSPSSIIIAADTVVLVGRRLIGKPKSLADARAALRIISKRPIWVYTGIAVIDAGRTFTDSEKTKVYMYPLTDEQINRYFRRVSPFDKAGSFDVQGPGSIFIDRIEGCFYNVVGLPLAKLGRILHKCGVEIF